MPGQETRGIDFILLKMMVFLNFYGFKWLDKEQDAQTFNNNNVTPKKNVVIKSLFHDNAFFILYIR